MKCPFCHTEFDERFATLEIGDFVSFEHPWGSRIKLLSGFVAQKMEENGQQRVIILVPNGTSKAERYTVDFARIRSESTPLPSLNATNVAIGNQTIGSQTIVHREKNA